MKTKQICIGLAVLVSLILLYYMFGMKRISGFEDGQTFTLYYASWCPHCKDVKPVFEQWMESKGGSMQVNGKTINLAIVEESDMPANAGVKGFPTFKLNNKECESGRTPAAWEQWLKANA